MSQPDIVKGVPAPSPPPQSQIDEERGDWEGMGQNQMPADEATETKPKDGKPTPGASSLAGEKG